MSIESLGDKARPFYVTQAEIDATHPMNDGVTCYAEDEAALVLVGERHGKRELVDLVRALIIRARPAATVNRQDRIAVSRALDGLKDRLFDANCLDAEAVALHSAGRDSFVRIMAPASDKPAQPVEAVDVRTAFEKWAGAKGYALHIRDMKGSTRLGEYGYADTQRLWETWQAALAHLRPTGDEAFIIKYEDADEPDEVFYGHGARGAAFKRYAQRSTAWSAHLFQRIDCNTSRGDTAGEQAGEEVPRMALGNNGALDAIPENEEQRVIATQYAVRALRLANLDVLPFVNGWLACHAQPRPVCVPDGWKVVPIKTTQEINEAGRKSLIESRKANVTYDTTAAYAYEEMVAAAPEVSRG